MRDPGPSFVAPAGFVGRTAEVRRLRALIAAGARLLTVVGPPGAGKTCLAGRLAGSAGGEVLWCDLGEVASPDGVVVAVATALGTARDLGARGEDPVDRIGRTLAARESALVVLDGFDAAVRWAEGTVGRWLLLAPRARFVATSREPLGLDGEALVEVGGLDPAAAMQLFVQRARAARPGFVAAADDREAIAEIVRRLEGLPLAVALAGGRVGVIGPRALLHRLEADPSVLEAAMPPADARHATLWAAIDASWALLSPAEREALAQAAVFRGGFTLEAAEGVIALAPPAPPVLSAVDALRRRSLLRSWVPADGADVRLAPYESVRRFAAERLDATGGRAAAEGRHAAWFLARAEAWAREARGVDGPDRLLRLALEAGNLADAHRRTFGRDDGTSARIALALDASLAVRGPVGERLRLLETAVQAAARSGEAALVARALCARGDAERQRGVPAGAERDALRAARQARLAGARDVEAEALALAGNARRLAGDHREAARRYARALALHRRSRDPRGEGVLRVWMAQLDQERSRPARARAHLERALALLRAAGDRAHEGVALTSLALVEHGAGNFRRARALYADALEAHRETGHRAFEGIVLGCLGGLALETGRIAEAGGHLERALAVARATGDRRNEGILLGDMGVVARERGQSRAADRLLRRAIELCREARYPLGEAVVLAHLAALSASEDAVAEAEADLRAARAALGPAPTPEIARTIDALGGEIYLARARQAAARGRRRDAAAHIARARRCLAACSGGRAHDLRLARRLLEAAIARHGARASTAGVAVRTRRAPRLVVGPDAAWFEAPGGPRVALGRRTSLRGILAALAHDRAGGGSDGLSTARLIEAGWPGERPDPASGANRAWVAIGRLRDLGLRGLLVRRGDRYLLDPAVRVEVRGGAER